MRTEISQITKTEREERKLGLDLCKRFGETDKRGKWTVRLLIEVTPVHSGKGVWCNWEKLGQEVFPLLLHLAGAVPGNHHSFKNVTLQTGANVLATLTS